MPINNNVLKHLQANNITICSLLCARPTVTQRLEVRTHLLTEVKANMKSKILRSVLSTREM